MKELSNLNNTKISNESHELLMKELSNLNNTKISNESYELLMKELLKNSKVSNELLMKELSNLNNTKIPNESYELLMKELSNDSKYEILNNSKVLNESMMKEILNNSKVLNDLMIKEISDINNSKYELLTKEVLNNSKAHNESYNLLAKEISDINNLIYSKTSNKSYELLMKEISNNFENSNEAIIYMMKEILNLNTSKVSNESYEILTKNISILNDDVKSLKKEFPIDFSNINSSMKEILDLRTYQKIESTNIVDINTFNNWIISEFDDNYNINEGINIAHKKYFSENNLVEINKIVKDEISQSMLNTIFYTNILKKNTEKDIFDPYRDETLFKNIIITTKYLLNLVNLTDSADKFIKYDFPPITNNDKLKMLFDTMITGFNTQLNERGSLSGILDMDMLKLQFITLLDNHKNIIESDKYNTLKTVLDNIFNSLQKLFKNGLPLLSWQQLMVKYFTMINMINPTLKDIYKSENENLIKANTFIYDYNNLSKQISGFMELFYNIGIFLSKFIDTINKQDNYDELKPNDLKWWNEHIILIFDYHKSLVLDDVVISEKIKNKLNILESPPNLNKMVDIYNNLIKNLYKTL
jgi:hypothetical protein